MSEKQRVLVVDDEPRNVRIVAEVFEGLVELSTANNGADGLAAVAGSSPDLILLDIMMPGIDGYEVCRRIRSDSRLDLTKIILVSGKAMVEERLRGYEVGADDYMTKPFVPEELLAKAKVFLRLIQAERELAEFNRSLEKQVKERTAELVEAQAKLANSAKMSALGEMAGGIAHEINTPLGTIGMIMGQIQELAADEAPDKAAILDMAKIAEQTVFRIAKIIQGLRTFSRDGSKDPCESVPVKRILENTLSLCEERFKQGGVKLEIEPFPESIHLYCRPVQISQVLLNLLNNAFDAVQALPDKWVKVSVRSVSGETEVAVTDAGAGIPADVRSKLFQPFFTTKEIGKGTGLGLSVSKGIVYSHQGQLHLDTGSNNTRFVLRLPSERKAA